MNLRDRINARAASQRVQLPGDLGDVNVLRIKTRDMLELSKLDANKAGMAMVARCVADDEGKPIFASTDEVADLDWVLVQALLGACYQVNGIQAKIELAQKN